VLQVIAKGSLQLKYDYRGESMKLLLKRFVKKALAGFVSVLSKTKAGRFIQSEIVRQTMRMTKKVKHNDCDLTFTIPNTLSYFRAESFSQKEPETLDWIDSIPEGSTVWDIGANVGLYSVYAAKYRSCNVYAFEPSVFNLELLARNIFINEMVGSITIVPLPLTETLKRSSLNMTSTDLGGALSTFGETYGYDGETLEKVFEFSTIGLSMVDAVQLLKIPVPDYIKLDVDGIEQLVLKGGEGILSVIKGLLIEVDDDFDEQRTMVHQYLSDAGLTLKEKTHSEMFEGNAKFGNSYNQIWCR
jgi:FkbM family methyltransferase